MHARKVARNQQQSMEEKEQGTKSKCVCKKCSKQLGKKVCKKSSKDLDEKVSKNRSKKLGKCV